MPAARLRMAAALINREARQHSWPANHPWFLPGAVLDNMPNYQEGIIQALRRFTLEMTDQIGRARGSSQADPDLEQARSSLNYASDVWVWNISISIFPTATSPQQYKAAEAALLSYNKRVAAGTGGVRPAVGQPARHARPHREGRRLDLGRPRAADRAAFRRLDRLPGRRPLLPHQGRALRLCAAAASSARTSIPC